MDERGYVAEALLDRLRADGVAFRLLTEALELAVPRQALAGMPRQIVIHAPKSALQRGGAALESALTVQEF